MKFEHVKIAIVSVFLLATVPSFLTAQEVRDPPIAAEGDGDFDFGWLGLLGLGGLFGLKRRRGDDPQWHVVR